MKLTKIFAYLFIGLVLLTTVSGSGGNSSELPAAENCKTVLRLVDTSKTATISGSIHNASFMGDANATVTVFLYNPDSQKYEEYKKFEVPKTLSRNDTEFSIFWLTPEKAYRIEISDINVPYVIGTLSLREGQIFGLNGGNPI